MRRYNKKVNFIKLFIAKEIKNFQKLHPEAKRLFSSIMLFNLINPIYSIFINAFLWRQSQDLVLIAFYNLIVFIFIPGAFYFNGWLLKKTSLNRLYFISAAIQGVAVSSLIFLNSLSYPAIIIFGILNGIGMGMYWANRNFLTFKTTQSDDRIYFSSLEASAETASRVIIPLFIGLFITFGTTIHLYTPLQGYQIISVGIILVTLAIGLVMRGNPIHIPFGSMLVKQPSKSWQRFQALQFTYGINHGILTFVPILMVLYLVGQEESLGVIQSLSAIIGSLTIFLLGKYLHIRHRLTLFAINVIFLIIGGGIFGFMYPALGVTVFFACQALPQPFMWVALNSLIGTP